MNILHHGRTTIAIDPEGMVNASLLAKHFGRRPEEYLLLPDSQQVIRQIAEHNGSSLHSQWQDTQLRRRHRPDFLRELTSAGVIRSVAGTVGSRVKNPRGSGGNGPINHDPGLWVDRLLAADLARWLECRGESWRPSPLAEVVENALGPKLPGGKA